MGALWLAGDPSPVRYGAGGNGAAMLRPSGVGSAALGSLLLPALALVSGDEVTLAASAAATAALPRAGALGGLVVNGRPLALGPVVWLPLVLLDIVAVFGVRAALVSLAAGLAGSALTVRGVAAFPKTFAAGEAALIAQFIAVFLASGSIGMLFGGDGYHRVLYAAALAAASALGFASRAVNGLLCFAGFALAVISVPYAYLLGAIVPFAAHLSITVVALAAAAVALHAAATRSVLPRIVLRKGYHVLALAAVWPLLAAEAGRRLVSVGSAGVLALLCALEAARLRRWPSEALSVALDAVLAPLRDSRDSGVLVTSHLSLAVGIGAPLWLLGADWPPEAPTAALAALCAGDAAAAAIGIKLGGRLVPRMPNGKSLEGALACFALTLWAQGDVLWWRPRAVAAAAAAAMAELVCTSNDNLLVPLAALVPWAAML